jgi:hypothetical protein
VAVVDPIIRSSGEGVSSFTGCPWERIVQDDNPMQISINNRITGLILGSFSY